MTQIPTAKSIPKKETKASSGPKQPNKEKMPKLKLLTDKEFERMHGIRGTDSARFWNSASSQEIFAYCRTLCAKHPVSTHREFAQLAPKPVVGFLGTSPKRWEEIGFENPISTIRNRNQAAANRSDLISIKRSREQVENKKRTSPKKKKKKETPIPQMTELTLVKIEEEPAEEIALLEQELPSETEMSPDQRAFVKLQDALETLSKWQKKYALEFIAKNIYLGSRNSPDNLLKISSTGEKFCVSLRREDGDWQIRSGDVPALVFASKIQFGSPLTRELEITTLLNELEAISTYRAVPFELGTKLWIIRDHWTSPHAAAPLFESGISRELNARLESAMESEIVEAYFASTCELFMGKIKDAPEPGAKP